jgi:hypothetical protein
MIRRLLVVAATVTALLAGPAAVVSAHADGPALPYVTTNDNPNWGHWACVTAAAVDFGACIDDPLPDQLPLPNLPPV